ncbi:MULTISPECIES: hypothetical protein [Pseudomonas]|uniref:hypothetical protein n=1 Tax=Pseudomonas TaxID=286 RepID=UPI0009C810C6|nr:hypothetical protein MF6394_07890 [Pseudomonas sp. MF6394]
MCSRLKLTWARALRWTVPDLLGAVHIPRQSHLTRHDYLSHDEFFRRFSYRSKVATKCFGDGTHGCGRSRY